MKRMKWMALLLLLAMAPAAPALAHKVNIFAYVEENTVYSESYFPDGRPVEQGRVVVSDTSGEQLLEGQTDAGGLFDFPLPEAGALTIVIDAGMGHKNSYLLKPTELKNQP